MIILSGVLVVAAIALLVAGIVAGNGDSAQVFGLDALVVIYISIAVSIVSAICLAIGVFLRRTELFGSGVAAAPARKSKKAAKDKRAKDQRAKDKRAKAAPTAPAGHAPAEQKASAPGKSGDTVAVPAPAADVPGEALVFVVRGRKRYHLGTCRQLAGRETEELTYAEAKEEGFSPCTACLPDTALAARAAVSAPVSPDAGRAAGEAPAPPRPGMERSEGGPGPTAEIPRPDPSAEPEPPAGPSTRAPGSAGPTLTDVPVAGLAPSGQGPRRAEKAGPGDPEGEDASGDRSARAGSATGGTAAPRPRDAGEPGAGPEPSAAPSGDGPQVRILSGTRRYHRIECALIEDIGDEADDLEELSRAEAQARGCTPCLVCQPDREHARD